MFENQWSVRKLRDCYRPQRIGLDGTLLPTDRSDELIHGVRYRGARSLAENGRKGGQRPPARSERLIEGIQGPRSSRLSGFSTSRSRRMCIFVKSRRTDAPQPQRPWSAL